MDIIINGEIFMDLHQILSMAQVNFHDEKQQRQQHLKRQVLMVHETDIMYEHLYMVVLMIGQILQIIIYGDDLVIRRVIIGDII
jgi:hypothetical protein